MISLPFDFNVRVKMFIIIMLIFSFLLAYLICLDMLLLLLLLFKFSLFVCLFVFGGFFWIFCFTNMICKYLPFISHLLSMSDGAQKAKGSKQRRKTATFMISILKKNTNFVVHDTTFLTIDFNRTFYQNRTKINCNIVPLHCW